MTTPNSPRRLWIAVGLLIVIVATGGYFVLRSGDGPGKSQTVSGSAPLRCAFDTWLGYSAFYIAEELGYYKDAGLNVELKVINAIQEKDAAMARGDLDCMGGSIDSAVISNASGVPGKIIFLFEASLGNDAMAVANTIKSAQDLKGKRIALEVGYVSQLFLLNYLRINGMTPKDVTILDTPNDQGVVAFVSKSIDAIATFEPFLSRALQRTDAVVLVSSKGMEPIFSGTAFASAAAIKSRPEDLKKLVAALQKANEYWLEHPKEGNAIVAKRWNLSVEEVEGIMVNTTLFTPKDQERHFGTAGAPGKLVDYLKICADLWRSSGEVKTEVDVTQLFDRRFVEPLYATDGSSGK